MKMCMKRRILTVLAAAMLVTAVIVPLCGCEDNSREKITVYLRDAQLMDEYASYIQSQVPEADIDFITGNDDTDFYKFLNKNGNLPDIITTQKFSLHDTDDFKQDLLDLSGTEEAASYYTTYLEKYRNNEGGINWLPLCSEIDGIIANRALFDKYNIPVPDDYDSFIYACRAFERLGIKGFAADFTDEKACLEILQGISVPELMSLEGREWRNGYEDISNREITSLDKEVWPGIFDNMENFIEDASVKPDDAVIDSDTLYKMFAEGKVAMIKGTGTVIIDHNAYEEKVNPIMLPYFGQNGENWLMTYPTLHVALNKDLEYNEHRRELAFKILDAMISEEGQNIIAGKKDAIPYNKDIDLELAEELNSIKPYIDENRMYIRIGSNDFFTASRNVVQKMIRREYGAGEAYTDFYGQLKDPWEVKDPPAVYLKASYSNRFSRAKGNQAFSAEATTLRKMYDADVLIAPSYVFTSPVMETGYSEKMLSYMIMSRSCEAYYKKMSGKELYTLIKTSVEGSKGTYRPFNDQSLPVISGAFVKVKEDNGEYSLDKVLINGIEIETNKEYNVIYLENDAYYRRMMDALYKGKGGFRQMDTAVKEAWTEYMLNGGKVSSPEEYIKVR